MKNIVLKQHRCNLTKTIHTKAYTANECSIYGKKDSYTSELHQLVEINLAQLQLLHFPRYCSLTKKILLHTLQQGEQLNTRVVHELVEIHFAQLLCVAHWKKELPHTLHASDKFLCLHVGTACHTTLWYHDCKRKKEEAAALGLDHPLPPSHKHKKHKQHDCSKCHLALSGN